MKHSEELRFLADHFRRTGYLKLVDLFSQEEIEPLRAEIAHAFAHPAGPVRRNEKGEVVRLAAAYHRFSSLRNLIVDDRFLTPLRALLGPNIELVVNRHNHSTLNGSSRKPDRLHRDILQWSRSLVTAVVYLEDSLVENGCTELIPGSQYLPFVGTPNNGGTWMDEHSVYSPLISQAIPIPMSSGSVLLFDSLAFHRAGTNRLGGERRSVVLGFHSVDELATDAYFKSRVLVAGERLYRGNELGDSM